MPTSVNMLLLFILEIIPEPFETGFWVDQDDNFVSDNTDTPILYAG